MSNRLAAFHLADARTPAALQPNRSRRLLAALGTALLGDATEALSARLRRDAGLPGAGRLAERVDAELARVRV